MFAIEIPCGKLVCNTCGHELWCGLIYTKEQFMEMICSECGNEYLKEVEKLEEVKEEQKTETESIENVECNAE